MSWPGRLLTGQSQHAILLVPGPGGHRHRRLPHLGHQGPKEPEAEEADEPKEPEISTDPYLSYRFITERKSVTRRRTKNRADASRAWWRELDTLVLAPDEHGTYVRPAVFDTLNDLPEDLRRSLRIRIHGFDQDGKVIDRQWYTAITPPLLNWTQEHDPAKAQRIAECCREAEQTAQRLATVAKKAWKTATHSGASKTTWANKALEIVFKGQIQSMMEAMVTAAW
ncbi:type I-E CRISPR-associated protein Cse1/CasA [Streptomyces sp. YPW6]|uniref:type I-E CRISPR-associated protein Cse1/CasA n=1 Tax=Streptomyces sp. YPW6 TaxID=2840373 RepID=UPI001C0E7AE9|nr:type I-E CRISPR-associated protein Cse1/CasA [Streptomyces sp. YPW6]QWQ39632.1 type I-E CRISPR-associated protein Cse1/CasA [Streptomyces sp. YPW6]